MVSLSITLNVASLLVYCFYLSIYLFMYLFWAAKRILFQLIPCPKNKTCKRKERKKVTTCSFVFLFFYSIGLSHDGDYNRCGGDAPLGSIMSPTVYSRFDRYFWSNCTKTQIRQNIRYDSIFLSWNYHCLRIDNSL